MLAGHYAPAFVLKAARPSVPLWVLFLAVQLVDVAWVVFVLTGVEHARVEPGYTASNGLVLESMPYSHGLFAGVVWAVAAGLVAARRWRGAGLVVALAVVSHWFADLPVHVGDLPLFGGGEPKLGFGLWRWRFGAFALEAGLLAVAAAVYRARVSPPQPRAFTRLCVVLGVVTVASYYGPQPGTLVLTVASTFATYVLFTWMAARVEHRGRGSVGEA